MLICCVLVCLCLCLCVCVVLVVCLIAPLVSSCLLVVCPLYWGGAFDGVFSWCVCVACLCVLFAWCVKLLVLLSNCVFHVVVLRFVLCARSPALFEVVLLVVLMLCCLVAGMFVLLLSVCAV